MSICDSGARREPGPGAGRLAARPAVLAAVLAAVLVSAAACGTTRVSVPPAPAGADPLCADLVEALPERLGDLEARTTDAAGTAAWGEPAVVLRCGTDPLGPTEAPCVRVEGVDWVELAAGDEGTLLGAYGREPGVQVEVPAALGPVGAVLPALSAAVARLPAERECL